MRVSACVIVKNEEKNLPRWIACVKEIADELLVMDTGSTDGTVKLAEAAGARVEYFKWIDDFAAARNYTIERVKGDWILFMDADEYFAEEDCQTVRLLMEKYHANPGIAGLMFPIMNIDPAIGQYRGGMSHVIRAFRNVKWLRYVGRIHEAITNVSGKGMKTIKSLSSPIIYHTGYSSDIIHKKVERNMAILQQEAGKREVDDFYFMDCYYGMDEFEKAIEYANKLIDEGIRVIGDETRVYVVLIDSLMKLDRSDAEIYSTLETASKLYPKAAEFYMLRGKQDWKRRAFSEAEKNYLHALELYEAEKQTGNTILGSYSFNFLPGTYLNLGEISTWKGRLSEAVGYFTEYLRLKPDNGNVVIKLCRLLRGVPTVDVVALFNSIYDREKDGKFLAALFWVADFREAALYYDEASERSLFDEVEKYILAGKLLAAGAELGNSIENLCDLGSWYQYCRCTDGSRREFLGLLPEHWQRAGLRQEHDGGRLEKKWKHLAEVTNSCVFQPVSS